MKYGKLYNTQETPQGQPIPGRTDQVKNSAGGYVFAAKDWDVLDRFLILGSDQPTYYASARKLTQDNAKNLIGLIKQDGARVVNRIVEISQAGRAPKNDAAIFALAMCAKFGDIATKTLAYQVYPKVARIGTHWYAFAEIGKNAFGMSGAGFLRALAQPYLNLPVPRLAYQGVKYRQRNGWSHRDILRITHAKTDDEARNAVFNWMVNGWDAVPTEPVDGGLELIWAFEKAKTADEKESIKLVTEYRLPWEALQTKHLRSPAVWQSLLDAGLPMHAALRNLARMTNIGLVKPLSAATKQLVKQFSDDEHIRKSRMHPLSVLVALKTYQRGHGMRGSLTWTPVAQIVDVLDEMFYKAFGNVEPANKRTMFACDISGSMSGPANLCGAPLTPREATAALAMVGLRTEPESFATAFCTQMVDFPLSKRERLDDVVTRMARLIMGGTDCAQPMIYARKKRLEVDTFVVLTDNETWAGHIHPVQALDQYQKKTGIPAKLIVVGMTATRFSIADPTRNDMLDVVGLDTATPNLISQFSRGL